MSTPPSYLTFDMLLRDHAEGDDDDAGMAAGGACAKCQYPRRKDYKHVCGRAYGRGRRAGPAPATQRSLRAQPDLAIGFTGECHCTAQRLHEHAARFATPPTASDLDRLCLQVPCNCQSPAGKQMKRRAANSIGDPGVGGVPTHGRCLLVWWHPPPRSPAKGKDGAECVQGSDANG